jgi:replicative DNA helicase
MEARRGPVDPSRITQSRELPHNLDAEMAILGALLTDNSAYDRIDGLADAADFYDPLHRQIFTEIVGAIAGGRAATPLTLKTAFETAPPLSPTLTVPGYLARLAANAGNLWHIGDHARGLHDLAVRRSLIAVMDEAQVTAYDPPSDMPAEKQIEAIETKLLALAEHGRAEEAESTFEDAVDAAVEMANRAYQRDGQLAGLSTGLIDLDNMLGGLQATDLIILAGRPGMGKTALATNIAHFNAQRRRLAMNSRDGWSDRAEDGAIVYFFSLEMSREQLALRVLAEASGIPSDIYRRGTATDHQMRLLMEAQSSIKDGKLYIDDTGGLSLARLAARARRAKRRHDIGLIVVDYLQLLAGSGRENRVQDVTEITVGLKALAKELEVPIIALSQLSRQVEARTDKRPQLSDLRESGSIEQDADVVMFCFREEYYVEREKPSPTDAAAMAEWDTKMENCRGKAEVILGKHRHGPTGIVQLSWNGKLTKFGNLARGQ